MAEADFRLMTEATGQRIAAALEALHLATVTGVKGATEANYRTGDVILTPANIGAVSTSAVIDISHGGTGATNIPNALINLGLMLKVNGGETIEAKINASATSGFIEVAPNVSDSPDTRYGYIGIRVYVANNQKFIILSQYSTGTLYYKYANTNGTLISTWKQINAT